MGFLKQVRNDIVFLRGALRGLRLTTPIAKNPSRVFPQLFDELAGRFGDAPALLGERESFSYRALAERSNRYARWALSQGIGRSDTVCLLMPNRPEYMAIWLGITRVGGVVALLNINLVGPSLAYCIDIVDAKHIIVAAELFDLLAKTQPLLKFQPKVWLHGDGGADHPRLDREVETFSGDALNASERPLLNINDRALYIYTSGTTGRPKAANVNHYRVMLASHGFAGVMNTQSTDRMYNCLPMYHTVGGVCTTGSLLIKGGTVVIREKFSAREFWDDVVRSDCTLFQYIGELCRYLLNTPPNPNETRHRLRLACGNGLRPDVWEEFKRRFRIPHIIEFYAATEGNVSLFNFEGKTGAVGRVPWFLAHRFPTAIVQYDVEKEQPMRNAEGFCIPCAPDKVGEVIGKIVQDPARPASRFEGYANRAEEEKKVLHDVFERGDAWFRTGDLMRKDENGYFYFVDRIGDTFRWKGENVSTTEVAETINAFPGVLETNVYGVQIQGREGRAGMAALVCERPLDLDSFHKYLVQNLPDYARPLFLRIMGEIEVTATFKQKKVDLARQGFDPTQISDALYFNDPAQKTFVRLDKALYDRIQSGQVRL
ncbi:MAG: long-chain-acyl-CoA synthetase [Xanthobacteraceae bacterium]